MDARTVILWHRSRLCESGNCVEVARIDNDLIAVRDSKDPDGPALLFTAEEWKAFIEGVRAGELG
jgi:hypothetical protein